MSRATVRLELVVWAGNPLNQRFCCVVTPRGGVDGETVSSVTSPVTGATQTRKCG
jgi:hypothetical protein